jgi:hypothetical protein
MRRFAADLCALVRFLVGINEMAQKDDKSYIFLSLDQRLLRVSEYEFASFASDDEISRFELQ